jgi:tRNA A58 N-methylase Trm61
MAAGIHEGAIVADLGSGPGAVSVLLARMVGLVGRVIAVDRDLEAVDAARAASVRGAVDNIFIDVADALEPGIAPGKVDVVMVRHLLGHNGGREHRIVANAAALVRAGGFVYLADVDATAFRMNPVDPDIEDLTSR